MADSPLSCTPSARISACRDAAARLLTRRGFLVGLAATAARLPEALAASLTPPTITGAEYIALLGADRPEVQPLPTNFYPDASERWVEVASGPLVEAIDTGFLVVCPACLFVNYASVPCQICEGIPLADPEEIASLIDDYTDDGVPQPDVMASDINIYRRSRALDLFDGPDEAFCYCLLLHAYRVMNTGSAVDYRILTALDREED